MIKDFLSQFFNKLKIYKSYIYTNKHTDVEFHYIDTIFEIIRVLSLDFIDYYWKLDLLHNVYKALISDRYSAEGWILAN